MVLGGGIDVGVGSSAEVGAISGSAPVIPTGVADSFPAALVSGVLSEGFLGSFNFRKSPSC